MICPFCKTDNDKVIDSRSTDDGHSIRRRRHCSKCNRRFTTYERIEDLIKLTVVKKDGSRVPYGREKIITGVKMACYKRPIPAEDIVKLAEDVEEELLKQSGQEVSSQVIGELTMKRLKQLDKIAYIRFASVYYDFQQAGQFIEEATEVLDQTNEINGQMEMF